MNGGCACAPPPDLAGTPEDLSMSPAPADAATSAPGDLAVDPGADLAAGDGTSGPAGVDLGSGKGHTGVGCSLGGDAAPTPWWAAWLLAAAALAWRRRRRS
jgi:MYXO-CTERM domain-containing protein